jgi:hypothetical protein
MIVVVHVVVLIDPVVVVRIAVTGVAIGVVVSMVRVGLMRGSIPIIRVTPSPCPSDTQGARFETPNAVGP